MNAARIRRFAFSGTQRYRLPSHYKNAKSAFRKERLMKKLLLTLALFAFVATPAVFAEEGTDTTAPGGEMTTPPATDTAPADTKKAKKAARKAAKKASKKKVKKETSTETTTETAPPATDTVPAPDAQ